MRLSGALFLIVYLSGPVFAGGDPNYTLAVGNASGEANGEVTIACTLDFSGGAALDGASWGVCHESPLLSVNCIGGIPNDCLDNGTITPGTTLAMTNAGAGPEYFSPATTEVGGTGWTVGLLVTLAGTESLPPRDGAELTQTMYSIGDVTTAEELVLPLTLCAIGDPTVFTLLGTAAGEIVPTVIDGAITIAPQEICIDLGCEGGLTDATLSWSVCSPFDYYTLHRGGELIDVLDGADDSYLDEALPPGPYHYELIGFAFPTPTGDPVLGTAGCDVNVVPITVEAVSPSSGHYSGGDTVMITGSGFETAPDPTVRFGETTATNVMVMDDTSLTCVTPAASSLGQVDVTVTNDTGSSTATDAFLIGFIRGDVTGDGEIALPDPLLGLDYFFANGPPPECPDALDADDNGLHTLSDTLLLLDFIFNDRTPPAAPHPAAGLDPTDDDPFGCL